MDGEVTPSFYAPRDMAPQPHSPRRYWGLYAGVVLALIPPGDKKSMTKRFIEYRVVAQVFEAGTQATIEFPHCVLGNALTGVVDKATWTLRADPKAIAKGEPGVGSRVLVQCINGDPNNAVITSGYRGDKDKDAPPAKDGDLALLLAYNGIEVGIDAAGALTLTRHGATKTDGTLDEDRSPKDQVGASVTLDAKGGVRVVTKRGEDEEQIVALDHEASTLTVRTKKGLTIEVQDGPAEVKASGDVSVISTGGGVTARAEGGDLVAAAPKGKVKLGGHASEKAMLGDKTVAWLQRLVQAIQVMNMSCAVGPTSPPLNAAAFAALGAELQTLLSQAVEVSPTP